MKIITIGGAGFVGNHLIDYITKNYDWEIIATKMTSETINKDIKIVDLDILSYEDVKNLIILHKPDYIVHLAAQSSVKLSWDNPQLTINVNVIGTLNILEAIRKHSPRTKILLVGSSEEYGDTMNHFDTLSEENELIPNNAYAISKLAQNHFMNMYYNAYNLNIVSTRSFNHCGPGQSDLFVVSDFCKQVALIESNLTPAKIYVGNLEVERDFTDVRDIVVAYCKILEFGRPGETYNVGSGKAISVRDILNNIIGMSSSKIIVETSSEKFRHIDNKKIESNISKIRNEINWSPQISLMETLKDTLDYWRNTI